MVSPSPKRELIILLSVTQSKKSIEFIMWENVVTHFSVNVFFCGLFYDANSSSDTQQHGKAGWLIRGNLYIFNELEGSCS